MDQLSLIQSGCQQWIRQPAAVHQHQFAVSSSLAIYIHAQQDFRLVKILAQHNQHLNAICWSPVDCKLVACATSEQVLKVYHLDSEAVVYSCQLPAADAVKKLCWSTHDESVLLAALGNTVGSWPYKAGEWRVLQTFKAAVTCMQQSASEPRLLAVGCADCSLHLYDLLVTKVVCTVKLDDGAVPSDIQFDPLSKQYLLLLCRNGAISMYGVDEGQRALNHVFSLAKQPAAERSAAFVPNQPGNFISISNKTGVLQLWNVSQQQPLKNMKTGKGPAQSVQFFPGTSKALLTFQDGTVMVYDVCSQEADWSTQPGHTETIFDCCFAPHNPRLLATCSFDGTVRVWDVGTGSCVKTLELPGTNSSTSSGVQNQGVPLYSVAWCPDGSQLASSSNRGAVYLYDYAKGIAIKKWQLHTKQSLKVAWHPSEPTLLVSSSTDGTVVAFKTDGTKVKVLRHTNGTSGCAWHPTSPYQLATTSEEGSVYIWDLSQPGGSCLLQTLNGHAKRSFSVAWSPLLPHLLLSGSDDATARVWDVQTGICGALLLGHTLEVRALCWHPEVPWLVFTGSWDSTIRAWDIRSRSCLSTCHDHHGDVYGLSIHAACPWVMASASRDTTVRLLDIKGLARGLLPRCFLEGAVPCGQSEQYAAHSLPLLCGSASQQLAGWCSRYLKANNAGQVSGLSASGKVELFQKLSAYFSAPGPANTLWQLAAAVAAQLSSQQVSLATSNAGSNAAAGSAAGSAVLLARCGSGAGGSAGGTTRPLPAYESFGFQHLTAAKQALTSAANQLELSVRSRGLGKTTMGAAKTEEALVEAALLHLQAGAVEHCCDLLVEAGEWDKALALAPAVSQEYWQLLLQQKADAAAKAGAPAKELLPLMLASGQTAALTELLMGQKQYGLAASIAAVHACGGYQHFATAKQQLGSPLRPHLSIKLEPVSPIEAAAVAAISSPTRTAGKPGSLSPLHAAAATAAAAAPQLLGPIESSTLMARRSSQLPPLKGAPGSGSFGPGALRHSASTGGMAAPGSAATVAVASPTAIATADPDRSWSLGCASSPGAGEGFGRANSSESPKLARLASLGLGVDTGATAGAPGGAGLLQATSGSLARMRSCGCVFGAAGGAAADPVALAQLAKVRSAQALAYRRQGQPLLAACASLTVNDVAAAISALHLGHEPEQAAMVALALGQLGGVHQDLLDSVYAALAVKCEAAGDWDAAASATKLLSTNVDHHLQLLVVRAEQNIERKSAAAEPSAGPGAAKSIVQGLRKQLGLSNAECYAARAETAPDALEAVRCLLLAGDHPRAAAKAMTHFHPLLEQLLQQVILIPPSSTDSLLQQQKQQQLQQAGQPLSQLQVVQQLLLWQGCLESLDPASLVLPCWQEVFACILLAGALRAFGQSYTQVGSYLMSCLRRWLEQHQVTFPLCRAALLVLEAQAIADSGPESACSLLIAAADGPGAPQDIKAAARQKLQGYPRPAAASSGSGSAADAGCVIVAGSSLPCRGPASGFCRSVVTGKAFEGPWRLLDDGSSFVSMSEAVMLSHVMRCGPCGTGSVVQLL